MRDRLSGRLKTVNRQIREEIKNLSAAMELICSQLDDGIGLAPLPGQNNLLRLMGERNAILGLMHNMELMNNIDVTYERAALKALAIAKGKQYRDMARDDSSLNENELTAAASALEAFADEVLS